MVKKLLQRFESLRSPGNDQPITNACMFILLSVCPYTFIH
jgi:hypothetical protein